MKQCPGVNKHTYSGGFDCDVKTRVANPRNRYTNDVPPFFAHVGDTRLVQQQWRDRRDQLLRIFESPFQGTCRPGLLGNTTSEMDVMSAISVE